MRAEEMTLDDVRALADALAYNTMLTTLKLRCTDSSCIGVDNEERNDWWRSYFMNYYGQTTIWEWKAPN
jgi:hypothetical protein